MPVRPATFRPHRTPGIKRFQKRERNRQADRALNTNSAEWRELRAQQLRRMPFCQCCVKRGCPRCGPNGTIRAARHVDHRDGDDSNNDPTNFDSLCKQCHSHKTVMKDGGFGRPKIKGEAE